MNKNGGGTITGVFITLLVVMGMFYGMFDYISSNYDDVGIVDELGYNQSYADIQESQASLNGNIENIKSSAQDIAEADSNIALIAWNGLTGLASTIRAMFDVIDLAVNVWNALLPGLTFFPTWVKILVEMAIIISIVLVLVGKFSGEAKT